MRLWKADLTVTPAYILDHPVYCAVYGSCVVGFYALSDRGTTRELEHMWVLPTRMGSGVEQLHATRTASVRIASDPNAEGFYRWMGARRVGRVPSRPAGRYLPVLAFRLRLSGWRNR